MEGSTPPLTLCFSDAQRPPHRRDPLRGADPQHEYDAALDGAHVLVVSGSIAFALGFIFLAVALAFVACFCVAQRKERARVQERVQERAQRDAVAAAAATHSQPPPPPQVATVPVAGGPYAQQQQQAAAAGYVQAPVPYQQPGVGVAYAQPAVAVPMQPGMAVATPVAPVQAWPVGQAQPGIQMAVPVAQPTMANQRIQSV